MSIDSNVGEGNPEVEVVETKATPEELKAIREELWNLVVASRSVVARAKQECQEKIERAEQELRSKVQECDEKGAVLLKRLRDDCAHQVVIWTRFVPAKRTFWGVVRQEYKSAAQMCMLCGVLSEGYVSEDASGYHSPLAANAFVLKEVSRQEFERYQNDWMHQSAVMVQVPVGFFK